MQTTSVISSTTTQSQGVSNSSAQSEMPEDSSKLSAYLTIISGCITNEIDTILNDHCYCKPWNWRPENAYVKPMRKIFFSNQNAKNISKKSINSETEIDVENADEVDVTAPIDMNRCRQSMDESLKLSASIRPDEMDEEWEEIVEKLLWTPLQRRLFTSVYKILCSERLTRLTKHNISNEPIYRRLSTDSTSKKFRDILSSTGWDVRIIQWLHDLLLDNLPQVYLIIYLDILQALRPKMPQLLDKIMTVPPNAPIKPNPIPTESINALVKRSWDPLSQCLNSSKPKKLPSNPTLIVIPNGIGTNTSSRHQKWLTQLGLLANVVNIQSHLGVAANRMTMMACMDQLVQTSRSKLQEVREDCPNRPIILIGFNTGAALACQVAQMEHVTAVVCLGFPFSTVEGKRGCPDDVLMDIRCPVMFVIGQKATLAKPDELEDLREKMLVETGLVVVGSADDYLRISSAKKMTEGISQCIVDRCILNEIGDFLGGILMQPHPMPLRTPTVGYDKNLQRDSRKRKNSTSSSVESESNCSNKISRPPTPVERQQIQLMQPSIVITKTTVSNTTPTQINHGFTSGTTISSTPIQKRKTRLSSSSLKISVADRNTANKPQLSINNGVNSMATVTPVMGPLRLSTTSNQTGTNSLKPIPNSNNVINKISKGPKMIHTGVNNQKTNKKIKTIPPATKTFNKINDTVDKLVTMNSLGGGQLRITSTGIQNKPATNNSSITAVLHSRKNFGNTIVNIPEGISITPTTQINVDSNSLASSSKSKESSHGIINGGVSMIEINDNTSGSIKILPWTSKIDQELPRITMSKNPLARIDESINFDDDLGNILDIPIIFAKDDDNLTDKPMVNPDVCDQKTRPTKIVLLSNKDDKTTLPFNLLETCEESVNWNDSSKQSGVKYTKIILSKKNNSANSNDQVKSPRNVSSTQVSNQQLESDLLVNFKSDN